tara:strand:+ start:265 stop:477 length:213 start_codon:yes stop_codon:yes gene_type:complete
MWSSGLRSISDAASIYKFFHREKTPIGVDVCYCKSKFYNVTALTSNTNQSGFLQQWTNPYIKMTHPMANP